MDDLVQQGIAALHVGERHKARLLLTEAVQTHPEDEHAWRALADAVESTIERRICLERFLALHGDDTTLRNELEQMGPAPNPEPSPTEIVSAVKTVVSVQSERRIRRAYWSWMHSS